jgi:ankyrin repeat protein
MTNDNGSSSVQATEPCTLGATMTTINPLADAAERNDLITAERLLKQDHVVDRKNAIGFTPLMIAAGLGYVQMTELLLTARADPTMVDTRMGATALHKAAQSGVVDVARLLVQHGAFLDPKHKTSDTTLQASMSSHYIPRFRFPTSAA